MCFRKQINFGNYTNQICFRVYVLNYRTYVITVIKLTSDRIWQQKYAAISYVRQDMAATCLFSCKFAKISGFASV